MQNSSDRVGFIGLGIMGLPMALNLIKNGHSLVIHNRTKSKAAPLQALGAKVVGSPKDVAKECGVTISMLADAGDVEQVLTEKDGYLSGCKEGGIFVDMGTNSPRGARRLESILAAKGVGFLDAPVTGGQRGAQEGTLTIMVGGKEADFERVRALFEHMGKKVIYAGPTGSGQLLKLCNQVVVALDMLACTEAFMIARKAGVSDTKLFEVLSNGAASSFTVQNLLPKIMKNDLEPGFKVAHLKKDLSYAADLARELGVPVLGTSTVLQLYTALTEMGYGEKGTQALKKVYDALSNKGRSVG